MSDSEEVTAKKIMSAITDRTRIRRDDLGHPDNCEVAYKYWQIFADEEQVNSIKCDCEKGLIGCADCKRRLGAAVNERLSEIRERRKYYETHVDEVVEIIRTGSEKARAEAKKVLAEVKNIIGMYQ